MCVCVAAAIATEYDKHNTTIWETGPASYAYGYVDYTDTSGDHYHLDCQSDGNVVLYFSLPTGPENPDPGWINDVMWETETCCH